MSTKKRDDEKTYKVQEFRNKKWRDFLIDDPSGEKDKNGDVKEIVKTVKISEEQAEELNKDAVVSGKKYVLNETSKPSKDSGEETPMAKAKRLKAEIKEAKTIEEVDALAEGGTTAVIKAAEERKAELTK